MILNLIQMTGGSVTFGDPAKPIAEANSGTLLSLTDEQWREMNYPIALKVELTSTDFEVVEQSEPEAKPYTYPATPSNGGQYL